MINWKVWLENHITLPENTTRREERANAATHLAGAVLAAAALAALTVRGIRMGSSTMLTGLVVYGLSMLLLYTASGFYHLVPASPLKRVLRILDHSNIYFLIAGTYTPILILVGTSLSYAFIGVVWSIAAAGIAFSLVFWGRLKPLHVVLYLVMGWLIVFIWKPVSQVLTPEFLGWILAGGLFYSGGVIFYAMKRLPYYHAVWHLFVLAGSASHFIGIYRFIPGG